MWQKAIISFFWLAGILNNACAQDGMAPATVLNKPDSVITFASSLYQPHSFLRRLFMGNTYRKEWRQYVTLPVFYFSQREFVIKDLGGSMQTKSLHMVDSLGKAWSLRTVDKHITGDGLSPMLRNRLGRELSQDLISAAFPYAGQLAGALCSAAGLIVARPQAFFVADDTALGPYRSIFANTLCTLEERDPGFENTDNALKFFENITADNRYKIQQQVLLKARLMDILIGDWDRHADNLRWGLKDSAGYLYYYAIPRDRDWAFYQSKGWLPQLAQKTGAYRCFINFDSKLKNIKNLSWKSWTSDKVLLNELTWADWEQAISEIQSMLTDEVIEKAVQILPRQIYETDRSSFVYKLKARRDALAKEVKKYYRFQAEEIIINGSNKEEIFLITANNDNLVITVSDAGKKQFYQRSFSSSETYLITLNGLGGADIFEIDEKVKSKIRIIINGGEGIDKYNIKGDVRIKIYDKAAENNSIVNKGKAKVYFN